MNFKERELIEPLQTFHKLVRDLATDFTLIMLT